MYVRDPRGRTAHAGAPHPSDTLSPVSPRWQRVYRLPGGNVSEPTFVVICILHHIYIAKTTTTFSRTLLLRTVLYDLSIGQNMVSCCALRLVFLAVALLRSTSGLKNVRLTTTTSCNRRFGFQLLCYKSETNAGNRHILRLGKALASLAAALNVVAGFPNGAIATDQWTDRNRLAADAWRAVDEIYYDRTFGGNDWFQLRQDIVKKSYKR